MSVRFADGFDHYSSTEIPLKWTQQFSAGIQSTIYRNGGQALFLVTGGAGNVGSVSITIDYQPTWTCGFALYVPNSSSSLAGGGNIYELVANGTTLMFLTINADYTFSVFTNGGTYGLSSVAIHGQSWFYIEVKNVLTGSNPIMIQSTVRINGVTVITSSTVTTGVNASSLISGLAQANRHVISGIGGNPSGAYFDDLYIADANSPGSTSFIGDISLGATYPDADVTTNFSIFPTTPTTHYTKVNEHPPDYDTTYIYQNTLGDQDTFNFQPISTAGTIPFVHFLIFARKDDSGTREIKHTVGGSTYPPGTGGYLGTPAFSLSDDYIYYRCVLDNDPAASGAAWTQSIFNAEVFGVEVFA